MLLKIDETAFKDLQYWKKHDKKKYQRIKKLIENILETPFEGLGKPEALRYQLKGYWSRRIDEKNRLIYKVTKTKLLIVAYRFHYKA